MNAQLQTITQLQTELIQPQPNIPRWNLALRIAFRFWMVYLGLYCLATQITTSLFTVTSATGTTFPDPATVWPFPVSTWFTLAALYAQKPALWQPPPPSR